MGIYLNEFDRGLENILVADEANIYVLMGRRRWPTRLASIQVGLMGIATLYGLTVSRKYNTRNKLACVFWGEFARFESRPGHWLFWMYMSATFFSSSRHVPRQYLKLGHGHFLLRHFIISNSLVVKLRYKSF